MDPELLAGHQLVQNLKPYRGHGTHDTDLEIYKVSYLIRATAKVLNFQTRFCEM